MMGAAKEEMRVSVEKSLAGYGAGLIGVCHVEEVGLIHRGMGYGVWGMGYGVWGNSI
jgi:hypothetical protein